MRHSVVLTNVTFVVHNITTRCNNFVSLFVESGIAQHLYSTLFITKVIEKSSKQAKPNTHATMIKLPVIHNYSRPTHCQTSGI